jgi:glutamate-1-semialdehyde aminotransferase
MCKEYHTQLKKKLTMNLSKSKKFLKQYKKIIPGIKIFNDFDPFEQGETPFGFEKGKDSFLWDIDGNKYLDFHMALGSIILGYSNNLVNRAALKQLKNGITFSLMNDLEIKVANKLINMIQKKYQDFTVILFSMFLHMIPW